jgi:hypothetical protein
MKDGTAGIAGTVVNHLRSDKSQIDALIAALKPRPATIATPATPTPQPEARP